jgi:hypothetical protein
MSRTKRQPARPDEGVQQIHAWLAAFSAFNEERLRAWPDDHLLAAERAKVAAEGHAIVEAMHSAYLTRGHRSHD